MQLNPCDPAHPIAALRAVGHPRLEGHHHNRAAQESNPVINMAQVKSEHHIWKWIQQSGFLQNLDPLLVKTYHWPCKSWRYMKLGRKFQTHPWSMSWKKTPPPCGTSDPLRKNDIEKTTPQDVIQTLSPKKGLLGQTTWETCAGEVHTQTHMHTSHEREITKIAPSEKQVLVEQMFQPHTITEQTSFLSFPLANFFSNFCEPWWLQPTSNTIWIQTPRYYFLSGLCVGGWVGIAITNFQSERWQACVYKVLACMITGHSSYNHACAEG